MQMLRFLAALGCVAIHCITSAAAETLVSDYVFVMPRQWFLLPASLGKDNQLQFRRYSVALHKDDFDAVKSGTKNQVQIIGQAGTFYNSMIFTCQGNKKKSDFLTFHFPADISPASFKYDEWKPRLDISILADRMSSTTDTAPAFRRTRATSSARSWTAGSSPPRANQVPDAGV